MKTEKEIQSAIEKKQTAYQKEAGKLTAVQTNKAVKEIKDLQKQLSDLITKGAKGATIGMKKAPGVYEIGNGKQRSRGETAQEAVENWNKGEYFKG